MLQQLDIIVGSRRCICWVSRYQSSVPQELMEEAASGDGERSTATDASGNPVLTDIGKQLAAQIKQHFNASTSDACDHSGGPVDIK